MIFFILGFTPLPLPLWLLAISAANHFALFLWVNVFTVFLPSFLSFIVTAQFFPILNMKGVFNLNPMLKASINSKTKRMNDE